MPTSRPSHPSGGFCAEDLDVDVSDVQVAMSLVFFLKEIGPAGQG